MTLSARCGVYSTWKHVLAKPKAKTTSGWNWKVI